MGDKEAIRYVSGLSLDAVVEAIFGKSDMLPRPRRKRRTKEQMLAERPEKSGPLEMPTEKTGTEQEGQVPPAPQPERKKKGKAWA
jgi:hypothetical protein